MGADMPSHRKGKPSALLMSLKRKRASESEKETDNVRRARRRAWLGILYIHDTCFPKNNNTALICHNLHNQCSRRGFALQCFSMNYKVYNMTLHAGLANPIAVCELRESNSKKKEKKMKNVGTYGRIGIFYLTPFPWTNCWSVMYFDELSHVTVSNLRFTSY